MGKKYPVACSFLFAAGLLPNDDVGLGRDTPLVQEVRSRKVFCVGGGGVDTL